MAKPKLQYGIGNSASTTLGSGITNTDTTAPLTSDTNFQAKSGEGVVLIDEGAVTEELAYSTGLSGGALAVPLANRGIEGGSAQAHSSGASVKGTFTTGMWNDLIDSLLNVLVQSTGVVDTTKIVTPSGTQTLTNKRVTKRVGTTTSSATPTPNADSHDEYTITALAAAAELQTPSGTPTDGQTLVIRIKDNGTARALTYVAIYRALGVTLPTTTVISKTLYLGCIYNSTDTKWDVVAVAQQA